MKIKENDEITFNYFFQIFQEKSQKKNLELVMNKIGDLDKLDFLFGVFYDANIPKEDQISIYKEALYETCLCYLSFSNTDINILPQNVFELIDIILNNLDKDPEKELFLQEDQMNTCKASFLYSLQFIYQIFLESLGLGYPMILKTLDFEQEVIPTLEITLSSRNEILNCEAIKINLIEQNKILTKLISMEYNHQIVPIHQVSMLIRKFI